MVKSCGLPHPRLFGLLLSVLSLLAWTELDARSISAETEWKSVNRLGLNLGNQTHWGAGQLLSNVLPNPGFEAWIERSLVTVTHSSGSTLTLSKPWNARPDHQWAGSQATVMTGPSTGQQFALADNASNPPHSAQLFASGSSLAGLSLTGQVLAISQHQLTPGSGLSPSPGKWRAGGQVRLIQGASQAGLGQTIVRLNPMGKQASLEVWLDALGSRADSPLLPIRSGWILALNLRSTGTAKLEIEVNRVGAAGRFTRLAQAEHVKPTGQWVSLQWPLRADSEQTVGTLAIALRGKGLGFIDLDNIYLGPANGLDSFLNGEQSAEAFRPEVIAMLRLLAPGYLRDWQGQLGDSAQNRFAPAAARHPHKYRKLETELISGYSIPEFLALCYQVHAKPWLILPSTWHATEIEEFARRLHHAQAQYPAKDWVLEFGNENWNAVFEAGGYLDKKQHAHAAQHSWSVFKKAFQALQPSRPLPHWLNNLQFVNPPTQPMLEALGPEAQWAVASYSVHALRQGDSTQSLFDPAHLNRWERWQRLSQAQGVGLWVPEVNLHPVAGDLQGEAKGRLLTQPEAGVALADNLLTGWLHGAATQVLYRLTGFDTYDAQRQLIPLFGLTPSLRTRQPTTADLRPSGQIMWALNEWLGEQPMHLKALSDLDAPLLAIALGHRPDNASFKTEGVAYLNRSDQFIAWAKTTPPQVVANQASAALTQKKDSATVKVWQLSSEGLRSESFQSVASLQSRGGLPPHSLLLIRWAQSSP